VCITRGTDQLPMLCTQAAQATLAPAWNQALPGTFTAGQLGGFDVNMYDDDGGTHQYIANFFFGIGGSEFMAGGFTTPGASGFSATVAPQ
jgi:hypothetical protein